MNNSNKPLLSVLLLSLFTLTALRGINLLSSRANVLGETTGTGNTYPSSLRKCADLHGTCSSNCKPTEKPYTGTDCSTQTCCVPFTAQPSPAPKPTFNNIPCAEIEKIQKLYCSPAIFSNTTPVINECKINGERSCRGNTIIVCLNNIWKTGEPCEKTCTAGHCLNVGNTLP